MTTASPAASEMLSPLPRKWSPSRALGGAWRAGLKVSQTRPEAGDAHRHPHVELLTWQRWITAQHLGHFEPKRWLSFNDANQIAQAALTGQGVALVRTPLVAESLASGALVEPFPQLRLDSPLAYWLIVGPRSAARPEVLAFCDWLRAQAAQTRQAIGEAPDADTVGGLD